MGDGGIWGVKTGIWGWRWRSGGGDGDIGGGDGDLGVGIFAYFTKQGEFWERVEWELVLQGNPTRCSVSVFFC